MRKRNKKSDDSIHLEMINRTAAIIRPKAPFLAWLQSIPELEMKDITLDELRSNEQTIFLLPECSSLEETSAAVNKIYKTIFKTELSGWWLDPTNWPKETTMNMFHEWFEVEVHSLVLDTTAEEFMVMDY